MGKLREILESADQEDIAFIIKGSPDPDAIGSSFALLNYYKTLGGSGKIYHSSPVSHSSNKAMINLLDIQMIEYGDVDQITENNYVIVDYSDPLIQGIECTRCLLHIDHHVNKEEVKVKNQIVDISVGSCATIITNLLKEEEYFVKDNTNVKVVATALSYGIKTDTDNLETARPKDWLAMSVLSQNHNPELLSKLNTVKITTQTASVLKRALKLEKQEQDWLYSGVGFLKEDYRDSIAIVADELLRRQGIQNVLVYAIIESEKGMRVEGSIRSGDPTFDLDSFSKSFSNEAGGRKYKGGFKIDLGFWASCHNRELLEELVKETVEGRLVSTLGTHTTHASEKKQREKKEESNVKVL